MLCYYFSLEEQEPAQAFWRGDCHLDCKIKQPREAGHAIRMCESEVPQKILKVKLGTNFKGW